MPRWSCMRAAFLLLLLTACGCEFFQETAATREPRYEAGAYMGAEFCGTCHAEIYEQWSTMSRHALATSTPGYLELLHEVTGNLVLNLTIGKAGCFSCHGPEEVNQGVGCETCHGPAPLGEPIMEVHERLYKPKRADVMQSSEFCSGCHEFGPQLTTYSDWQASPAAARGEQCQTCHMPIVGDTLRFHGFQSATRNPGLYVGDLLIEDVSVAGDELRLVLVNTIDGHSIPVGGPSRVLALEVTLYDKYGEPRHEYTDTFAKHASLLFDILPATLVSNTQLQAGERRALTYALPDVDLAEVRLVLRMYEVPEDAPQDLSAARWVSEAIVDERVALNSAQ